MAAIRRTLFPSTGRLVSPARFASTSVASEKFLITGGLGQIGTDLATALRKKYGRDNVIVSDIHKPSDAVRASGPYVYLDALNRQRMEDVVVTEGVTYIVHLSAIMSVLGEQIPHKCMDLNIDGARNALEVARIHKCKIFSPSTMAVFGPDAGKVMTKDDTILNPTTIYGITKVLLEQLGNYYHHKFGVDFRGVRYPGIISAPTLPGGGTTDYAVHMYHSALKGQKYTCPVLPNEPLPMMYMDDAIDGTIQLMEADRSLLKRCTYNIAGFSFTPDELHKSIEKHLPLQMEYKEGLAQKIAHSWPDSMDDSNARKDWGYKPHFDLDRMTEAMLRDIPLYHSISKQ